MQIDLLLLKRMLLAIVVFMGITLPSQGQIPLTIDKAMEIAQENSPSLRRSYMNLERYKQNLIAQKASLKSRFSLNLNPLDYNKNRRFDNRLSQWYTNETLNSSGTFQIEQPILWTDGTISLINKFGWQDNNSILEGNKTSDRAFSNDLYLQLTQPIFTYNKRKMELKQIEYDYENADISYALQRLNTEKSITDQFYAVYMAQSNLEISREELINAQQSYDIIKNKVEADLAAKDELFQAELNLATARSSVDESKVSLENAKDKLKQTLGMRLDEDILVFAEVDIKPIQVDLEQAITHGLGSRLELRQREIESKELEFEMIKTKALNEFKGDISLSFGLMGVRIDVESFVNCRYGYDVRCEVVCEEGCLNLPEPANAMIRTNDARVTPICHDWSERFPEAYNIEFQSWINACKEGRVDGPSAWDGYVGQVTAKAASKARDTQTVVEIHYDEMPDFYKK